MTDQNSATSTEAHMAIIRNRFRRQSIVHPDNGAVGLTKQTPERAA